MSGFARGLRAGALAGAATVGAMEVAAALVGVRTLPDVLEQPFLALLPGPVFGFLIDTLQHAGKVLEEAGLLGATWAGLALLGGAYGAFHERRPLPHLALAAGAVFWAAVCLVLLPLGGVGVLGLADGLTTPVVWGVLAAIYMLVLELAYGPAQPVAPDPGRRQALVTIPAAAAVVGVGLTALRLGPGWYRALFAPPEAGRAGPAPELTPVRNFYVVSKNLSDPVVDGAGWSLNVHGLVDSPFRLSLGELRSLPARTILLTLECISNPVGGGLMSTGRFTGVPLGDLLGRAQVRSSARFVAFRARDGFAESIPLDAVATSADVLVAHSLDDAPLPPEHGFPARVLIPGRYGMKQPKWLEDIELTTSEVTGYWEQQGWSRDAIVRTTSRIDTPAEGQVVPAGTVQVAGVAFAGTRGIQRVEVSDDGGRTWQDADLKPPLSPLTWTLWTFTWAASSEGARTLGVRATDGTGVLQSSQGRPSFPDGAGGYHTVHVNVGR